MQRSFVNIFALISLALAGCSTMARGTASARQPSSVESPLCSPDCTLQQVCMNTFKGFGIPANPVCVTTPAPAPISSLTLPFDANTEATCTHSSGSGSHSSANAFFALDLATDYRLPAAIVRASAEGKVYAFMGEDGKLCPEPIGTPANAAISNCGGSWGNHIMIWHGNGYASFYVHLDHFLVANGTVVHRGDPIGVEGWTGAAGHRHVHWSVQKLQGSTQAEWDRDLNQGWTGASIPFSFSAVQNGVEQEVNVAKLRCAHAAIGAAPAVQQPKFRGISEPSIPMEFKD